MGIEEITGLVVEYSPDQLKFKNYELPNFIVDKNGKEMIEAEELLAWILDYSRREKKWLAVEQRQINDSVQKGYTDYQEKKRLVESNKRRKSIFRRIKFMYYLKVILTFGLYIKNNPTPMIRLHADIPMMDAGRIELFEKPLYDFLESFKQSYSYLRNNGYLHAKTCGYILYLYPSEKVLNDVRKFTLPASFYVKK